MVLFFLSLIRQDSFRITLFDINKQAVNLLIPRFVSNQISVYRFFI